MVKHILIHTHKHTYSVHRDTKPPHIHTHICTHVHTTHTHIHDSIKILFPNIASGLSHHSLTFIITFLFFQFKLGAFANGQLWTSFSFFFSLSYQQLSFSVSTIFKKCKWILLGIIPSLKTWHSNVELSVSLFITDYPATSEHKLALPHKIPIIDSTILLQWTISSTLYYEKLNIVFQSKNLATILDL